MTTLLDQLAADLAGKYDPTFSFAESVTGPNGAFYAVFSKEYREADAGGYVTVSTSAPTLRCRDADALTKGDSVTVRSQEYQVVEVLPDGYGETRLRLQKS